MNTTPDDFKIKALVKDKDALLLIGLSILLGVLIVLGLALLSDAQWERLVTRSKVLYAAALAAIPAVLALYARFKLREAAVRSLGQASSPLVHNEQKVGPVQTEPASVVRAPNPVANEPILPRGAGD
jgi:hypothetical protein